ncbi:hypothetical protein ABZW32_14585 [Streptomyces sp. NPDC004667]|uniref:hypothetical protein n=1 Tax=Streptomyces sp. NPDC004667 TaxID=3154285 RepID=UPI0033B69463
MDKVIEFIKAEPEAATVFAALLAIVGGFLGSLASGWVQALGGKAQASAAVEAARISAEAQRIASLHTDRRKEIAAFIYEARHAVNTGNRLFSPISPTEVSALQTAVQAAYRALTVKQAELEIIAPVEVVERASDLVGAVEDFLRMVSMRGAASRAFESLTQVRPGDSDHAASHQAYSALDALRTAYGEEDAEQQQRDRRTEAETALREVSSLDSSQALLLLDDARLPALVPLHHQMMGAFSSALRGLVISSRLVLRANDTQQD